jgi:pyruvate,orthophosphate dikinase
MARFGMQSTLLAVWIASASMNTAFGFVAPFGFSSKGGSEPPEVSKTKSAKDKDHKANRTNNKQQIMTTIYMTSTMAGVKQPKGPAFPEEGGKVLGTGATDELVQAIVPFGGSAPSVPNPNKNILGGKGLGLQEMSSIGIDVPPGFTLTTPLCSVFQETGDLPNDLWLEVENAVKTVEADMGRKFGDPEHPLLFSCRSGAAVSMPGMMDTVLNIVSSNDAC